MHAPAAEPTPRCPACKAELTALVERCPGCGAALDEPARAAVLRWQERGWAAERRRRRRLLWIVVGTLLAFGLLYGLPRSFIAIGDAARDELDFGDYDADFEIDLAPAATWYRLARFSPLTFGMADQRRADLLAAAGHEVYLDGMHFRSRRHFGAAWRYFQRAARIRASRELITSYASLAAQQGRAVRVVALAERYPKYAPSFAFQHTQALMFLGRFDRAGPLLARSCRSGRSAFECERASLALAAAGRWNRAARVARHRVELLDRSRSSVMPAPLAKPGAEPERHDRERLAAHLLEARILDRLGRPERAAALRQEVLEAGESHSWAVARLDQVARLEADDRHRAAADLLRQGAPEVEAGARQDGYPGQAWHLLALRRAAAAVRRDEPDAALDALRAHFGRLGAIRAGGLRVGFNRFRLLFEVDGALPERHLTPAVAALAELEAESAVVARGWAALAACRSRLARFALDDMDACLDRAAAIAGEQAVAGMRFWTAAARGHWQRAADLCAERAAARQPGPGLAGRWLLAELRLGRTERALEVWRRLGPDPRTELQPEQVERLLRGLAALSGTRSGATGQPQPAAENGAHRVQTRGAWPRLAAALEALERGEAQRAVRLLGRQGLHYHIYWMHGWGPLARALFLAADPSGRDLRFVLQADVQLLNGSLFHDYGRFRWMLAEIVGLGPQPGADGDPLAAALERHREALRTTADLLWGL